MLADGDVVAEVGAGICILLGVAESDDTEVAARLAHRVAQLRIFENDEGKFDRSLLDVDGSALVVSQFTLIADYKRQEGTAGPAFVPAWKGNRPSFTRAAGRKQAEPLYERFVEELRALGIPTETGVFGARMVVEIANVGPVTIILEAASEGG
jgi:D-tyrosyl-tRNA(Tyr) deacylase